MIISFIIQHSFAVIGIISFLFLYWNCCIASQYVFESLRSCRIILHDHLTHSFFVYYLKVVELCGYLTFFQLTILLLYFITFSDLIEILSVISYHFMGSIDITWIQYDYLILKLFELYFSCITEVSTNVFNRHIRAVKPHDFHHHCFIYRWLNAI